MADLTYQAEVVFHERRELARHLQSEGKGLEDIAVAIYGRSDGMTIAAARDLLREEG